MSIELKNVSYIYDADQKVVVKALDDVSLTIEKGEFIGIIGHTGSGKSTMIQFFNGLMKPTEGTILFDGQDISDKDYNLRELRTQVGLVFQYPEHQLFETEVFKDICYGPRNMKLSEEEIEARAREAMAAVGLDESYEKKSPFDLSGGEKRRVAIAGVLAMKPSYLILDEPTAGLDPQGREEILECVRGLNREQGITIILVTHSMEDVAEYAGRLIVMSKGKKVMDAPPREVFKRYKELEEIGLSAPAVTYVAHKLKQRGFDIDTSVMTVSETAAEIMKALKKVKK